MGSKPKSPEAVVLLSAEEILTVDLQTFNTFGVKTGESYASVEAQAGDEPAPETDDDTSAQEAGTQGEQEEPEGSETSDESDDDAEDASQEDEPDDDGEKTQGSDGKDGKAQSEWVVPGKFRTYDDVLRAQQHAEKQLGRLHRELAELKRQGASKAEVEAQEQKIESAEDRAQANRNLLREFVKDPVGFQEKLAKQVRENLEREQRAQQERAEEIRRTVNEGIEMVAAQFDDFASLQDAISQEIANNRALQRTLSVLNSDPDATPSDYADLVRTAYLSVQSQVAAGALSAVREQGRREAEQAAKNRSRAQVASGGTRRDQTQETAEDIIRREVAGAVRSRGIWRK